MKLKNLTHEFVENIPEAIDEGILYISIPYTTAVHSCCCGCGLEVVTPFSSTDWELNFNGETVSLSPSIGNWSFPCRSHYWIKRNKVRWAGDMSSNKIKEIRMKDKAAKEKYFNAAEKESQALHYGEKIRPKKLDDPKTQPIQTEIIERPSMLIRFWNLIKW